MNTPVSVSLARIIITDSMIDAESSPAFFARLFVVLPCETVAKGISNAAKKK